jgi:putative acetyltransferase
MEVRPATPGDAEALPELHAAAVEASGPGDYDDEQVEHWAARDERSPGDYPVEDADSHFTVCIREGAVAGFAELAVEAAEIHAVYVHPDHARAGVGSTLLAELEGFARGRGMESLSLQSSLNATGFYERAGYEEVDRDESPGGLRVVEMRKRL